jgi:probable lipoprotein NlpC
MLLTGCHSSKNSGKRVSGSSAYNPSSSIVKQPNNNYSNESTSDMGQALTREARKWIGTPYRFGGADHSGVDCSGFVMTLYQSVCNTKLPRTTTEQQAYCTEVARNKASVGDLVFFSTTKGRNGVSHVGLYIGNGEMIHASSSQGVMVSNVDTGYWGDRLCGVGHVDSAEQLWQKTHKSKGKKQQTNSPAAIQPTQPEQHPAPSNNLPLDIIINQKVDSIIEVQIPD